MVWALLLRASSDASSPLPHDFADLSHMSLCCPSSRQKSPSLFSCSPQGAVPHLRSSLCFSTFFSCNVSFWGWGDWNYMQYSRYVRTMDLHSGMMFSFLFSTLFLVSPDIWFIYFIRKKPPHFFPQWILKIINLAFLQYHYIPWAFLSCINHQMAPQIDRLLAPDVFQGFMDSLLVLMTSRSCSHR